MIYILQSVLVGIYETWQEFSWPREVMGFVAIIILALEGIQISFNPKEYLSNPFNYMDIVGNTLVIMTRW